MAIITKNGKEGKICSTCHLWKSLDEFPSDPSHGVLQGGKHCRCRQCHRESEKIKHRSG